MPHPPNKGHATTSQISSAVTFRNTMKKEAIRHVDGASRPGCCGTATCKYPAWGKKGIIIKMVFKTSVCWMSDVFWPQHPRCCDP